MQSRLYNLLLNEVKMHGINFSYYKDKDPRYTYKKAREALGSHNYVERGWNSLKDPTIAGLSFNIGKPTVMINKSYQHHKIPTDNFKNPAVRRNVIAHEAFHAKLKNSPKSGKFRKWLGSRESLAYAVGGWKTRRKPTTVGGRIMEYPHRAMDAVKQLRNYFSWAKKGGYPNNYTGKLMNRLGIKEEKDLVDYITSSPKRNLSGSSRAYRRMLRLFYEKANEKYDPKNPMGGTKYALKATRIKHTIPQTKERAMKRFMNVELNSKRHKRRYNPKD